MKKFFLIGITYLSLLNFVAAENHLHTDTSDFQSDMSFFDEKTKKNTLLARSKQHSIFKKRNREAILAPLIYQNPFMAKNNFSEIHNNSFQTDTFSVRGPGRTKHAYVKSSIINPPSGIGATIAFNKQNQIITYRTTANVSQQTIENNLLLIDSTTLTVIAQTELPSRAISSDKVSFAGAYFYLDHLDRPVCTTSNQEIRIYAIENDNFKLVESFDLSATINNPEDLLNSVLPDSFGNLWFITQQAVLGYIDSEGNTFFTKIKEVSSADPNEKISKSFASDQNGGIYIVTDYALYRFDIGMNGNPTLNWRNSYDRGTRIKSGQNQQGSGTTPTLFDDFDGNEFVTIADNSDPFAHVLVFNRKNGELIAKQKVFTHLPFKNSCENSLIAVNHSVIIENNFGNDDIKSTAGRKTTKPGIARVDFNPASGESKVIWDNYNIAIPSVVSGLSTKDGLIYTYAKDQKGWYFAAINYRTGAIESKCRVARGGALKSILANNFYSGLNVGRDGTAYVGVIGGIVAWRPEKK